MLLQQLFTPEYEGAKEAYGVILDQGSMEAQYATPPNSLEMIGFIFKVDDDLMLEESLLDIIISYKLTNVGVVLEVPCDMFFGDKAVEPKYLLQLASNVDFSLSILPPEHPLVKERVTPQQYTALMEQFTKELLSRPNFDKQVLPVTSFFNYLMLEKIVGAEKSSQFTPEDAYIIENFSSLMAAQDSDKFKNAIRAQLYDFYGGENEFNSVSQLMFDTLYKKARSVFKQHISSHIEQQKEGQVQPS